MKKIALVLFAVVALSQYGCKRICTECTYQWELVNGEKNYTLQPEFCGSEAALKDYKEEELIKAKQLAAQVGGKNVTLRCIDQK